MGSSNVIKIGSKIVGFQVKKPNAVQPAPVSMSEAIVRPETLEGTTYKIKPPTFEAAIYVTINDITLPSGECRPYEIFINTKDTTALQWMTITTRLLSAVFRKGGDCTFVIEEMKSVFDSKGGYFGPGGIWRNSVVSEIGEVIERHLTDLGMLGAKKAPPADKDLKDAQVCQKCHEKAVVIMDGCQTCLSCGASKCG